MAFTVMDLEARQRPDLGNAFLNRMWSKLGTGRVAGAAVVFEPAGVCTGEGEFLVVG